MLNKVILPLLTLGSLLILGINCTVFSRYDNPYDVLSQNPFANLNLRQQSNSWRNAHQLARDTESLEEETSNEKDREPLGPDYKDPIGQGTDNVPEVKTTKDTPFFQKGIIDVDVGGLDFPSGFPDIPETFSFGGTFNTHRFPDGGLFDLNGFFGGNDFKPWWKGENVCIEREETNEDETTEDDEDDDKDASRNENKKNATEKREERVPNFFATSISLSNCHQTPSKYECVTKINNHGLTKTLTVRYKCCYGFERTEGSLSGCTKKLNLKTTLETIEENDGKEFTTMIKTAKLDDRLNNENLTVFVPTDNSLNEFTERMLEMNNIDILEQVRRKRQTRNAVSTEELILNHITKGFVDLNDLDNEQILKSENNGGSIRINLYPTPNYQRMLTASCAKITKGNNLAKNGIVHVVDGVVVPAIQSIQEIIDESRQLTSLKRMMESTNFAKLLKDDGHYTIFAPTDVAFNKLDESTRQKLLKGDACALSILRHHAVAHTVCSAAVIGNATTHNIDGEIINMERKDNDEIVIEDLAKLTQADVIATNGVIHLIDTVLIPDSAQYINQALKTHNFTKFQNYIERAGMMDTINNYKNATIFAPSDKAFEDSDALSYLDSIKDDKDQLRNFVNYHTVEGQLQSCDLNDNAMIKTNDGNTFRVNLYSTVPIFTNIINTATINCARITNYNEKACGSTIHEINKILVPPNKNILEIIKSEPKYSTLVEIVTGTDVEKILEDKDNAITLLAPDNDAFDTIDDEDLTLLKKDKEKAGIVLKNHILTEILCCNGVGPQPYGFNNLIKTLSNQIQPISRRGDHRIRIGRATILKCDSMATNGVVHRVDKILFPHSRHEPAFGFYFFDI